MAEFNAERIAELMVPDWTPQQQEIQSIATNIRQKSTEPDLSQPPSTSTPYSNYYFGENIAAPVRGSLEVTNYNIDDAYTRLNDGTYIAKYDTYKVGRNNAEYFAQNQSIGEKWVNGTTKFLGQIGTAVIGGTAGIGYGIGSAIEEGSWTAVYDNDLTNWLDDLNTKLQNNLPNYYTQQEQEKGLFGQLGTANFWADKVLGGLSFTAGAIISEGLWAYATGGSSIGNSLARWSTKGLGFSKVAQGVNTYKNVLKAPLVEAYQAGKVAKNTAVALGRTGDIFNTARFALTSAGYEASVEALQYKKEATEDFYNNFEQLNGRPPAPEDVQEFELNLNESANAVFGLNMAIVGSSNIATIGNIFKLRNPINTGITDFIEKKAFGRGIEKTAEGTFDLIKATRGQRIARNIYDFGKAPIVEGLYEEGGQGVISNTAKKWIEHSYNPQLTTENAELAGMVYESLAEQYGTKEGWVENGVGMIIGALGGTVNATSGRNAINQELEYKKAGLKTFQEKVIQERFLLANRVSGFSQEATQEEQKGNVVKSRIATDGVLFSRLNHAYQLGENLDTVVKEAKVSLDAMTPEQFEQAGVPASEIENFKEQSINQYAEMAREFKKNRVYAEYVIGRSTIAGIDAVTSAGDSALGTDNQEALIQSLTWTLTAGEQANNLMRDTSKAIQQTVGSEQANVLNIAAQLKKQQSSKRGQLTKNVNKRQALIEERERLQKSLLEIQQAPRELEGDRVRGAELGEMNLRILELNNTITGLDSEIQSFADEINSQNQYQQELGEIKLDQIQDFSSMIMAEDLINLKDNIQKFENLVKSYSTVNPQKYQYIIDLLDEYNQAEDIFLTNQRTALMLSSGKLNVKNINTWLGTKLNKGQKLDEVTKEWLIDVLEKYQQNKIAALDTTVEAEDAISDEVFETFDQTGEIPTEVIENIATKVASQSNLSSREQAVLREKSAEIDAIIRETPVAKTETTAPIEVLTPAEQLKQRLDNLLTTGYNSLTYIGENYDDLYLKKPTKAEIEKYRELREQNSDSEEFQLLQDKLSNWRLLDSAVNEENQSIVDLIELIEQLETTVEQENTQDELTADDIATVAQADKDGVSNSVVRYDLAQNTLGSVTVQYLKDRGVYKFSHLKINSVLDKLGIPFNSDRVSIVRDGKVIKRRLRESDFENYKPGTVFHIDNTKITVGAGNTLEIKAEDYQTLKDTLNLHIIVPSINWSYFDVYEIVGENGEMQKRPSDFQEDINPQLLYDIKPDDELGLVVANDSYNQQLRERIQNEEMSPELEKEILNSLKIYITYKGQPVSVLKATNTIVAPSDSFLLLRETAKNAFIANPNNPLIKGTVKARKVFLGSPQIRENISLTPTAIQNVVATGYVENGEVTLNREVGETDQTYISGFKGTDKTKKIPVIAFKKGAYTVVYPVSLVKSSNPQAESIQMIVENPTLTETQKIKAINQRIIETGIASDKRLSEYDTQKIEEIIQEFAKHQTFVSMNAFSSPDYRFQNLAQDVLINIDLDNLGQVISDPKIEIDLSTIQVSIPKEDRYNNMVEIEERASELAIELDRDFTLNADTKYLDSKGNIIEDTVYTDVFDEGLVEKNPTSHTQKIRNLNALRQAFSEKLPNTIKSALSPEVIQEVEFLLKKYDMLKTQVTPNKEAAERAIRDNICG